MIKLTAENVEKIFLNCLFKDAEMVDGKPNVEPVVVEGVVRKFGFHPSRLESHRQELIELLSQTEPSFHANSGGGMSFLSLCNTADGDLWGQHLHMEQLVTLGIGLGLMKFCVPRDMWSALPGGMPYIVIDLSKSTENAQ